MELLGRRMIAAEAVIGSCDGYALQGEGCWQRDTKCFVRQLANYSSKRLVEEGERPCRVVGNAKQKLEATIELNMINVINGMHAIPGE